MIVEIIDGIKINNEDYKLLQLEFDNNFNWILFLNMAMLFIIILGLLKILFIFIFKT